jgi:CubicO group peptidase (beta-lactamase class C family)
MNYRKDLRQPRLYNSSLTRVSTAATLLLLGVPAGHAATPGSAERSAAATEILQSVVDGGPVPVPAVAISVFKGSEEVFRAAAGDANVAGGVAARPETRFRTYSTAKSFTAAAAFSMAEAGELDLDAPIAKYLADLPTEKRTITTRQLLAHRAGIRHYEDGEWIPVSSRRCADPLEALADFIDDPLLHAPGTETEYSSFGYALASAVLQAAADESFTGLMRRHVFAPAGMRSIAVEGIPIEGFPIADFYLDKEDPTSSFVSTSTQSIDASCKFGGGGFVAGARDLAAFGSALLDGRLLSERALGDMTEVVTPAADDGSHPPLAYGIFVEEVFPSFGDLPPEQTSRALWHGGSARGGYSVMIAYPDEGVTVGIVSNVNAGGWLIFKAHDIARLWWKSRP